MVSSAFVAVLAAAAASKVAAFPSLYDSFWDGCLIPGTSYAGHAEPVENPDVVVEFLANTTSITEYVPGQIYTVRSPAYARITNCWIHASDGVIQPFNATTHQTASTCLEAAFSLQPVAVHEFLWTSTEAGGCVEFTVAQAVGASDAYNAAALVICPGSADAPLGESQAPLAVVPVSAVQPAMSVLPPPDAPPVAEAPPASSGLQVAPDAPPPASTPEPSAAAPSAESPRAFQAPPPADIAASPLASDTASDEEETAETTPDVAPDTSQSTFVAAPSSLTALTVTALTVLLSFAL